MNKGVRDPEVRFARATQWGDPPSHRPELGPCLIYLGGDNGNGYGQFRYGGRNGYVHRYAWERVNGPIPDELTVDHLCRVRKCANVDHLELTDRLDNFMRGVAVRTHCPNGHEYTGETRRGRRQCGECVRDSWRKLEAKRTAERHARGLRNLKYDPTLRDELAVCVVERRLTLREAAEKLGCNPKYMDKRARIEARKRGILNRRNT